MRATSTVSLVRRCRRGAVSALVALSMAPLVTTIGLAVDTARGYLVKSRLSQAIDAAGLAGGRIMSSANRDADIRMYFNANFPAGFMGATVTDPVITPSADGNSITLSATASVPTTFLKVAHIDTMSVASSTQIERQLLPLEVVLSMDLSGSMTTTDAGGGLSRFQAAKNAATTLIGILFGANTTNDNLKIGLVPWNGKVNVWLAGQIYNSALTTTVAAPAGFVNPITGVAQATLWKANNSPVLLLSQPQSTWKGCVYERYLADGNATDDADIYEGDYTGGGKTWITAWQPIPTAEGEPTASGSTHCSLAQAAGQPNGVDCTPCLSKGITPMTSTKQTILDALNNLPSPNGDTNQVSGLGWAWRMLTPAAPFSESTSDQQTTQQAIILMTDGQNNAGYGDAYKSAFGVGSAGRPGMDARLQVLAQNIKNAGIKIYVIQEGQVSNALKTLLQGIASAPSSPYYFYAPDATTLNDAFKQIADHLSSLRIAQ
ncbi:MAG: VWA domain-containing protein [Gemmatimonas sp.]